MNTASLPRYPEGIHNFRQVAGYPLREGGRIRSNMVYRSGALDRMSEADRSWLVESVGVRTILDLRHPDEWTQTGNAHGLADRVVAVSVFPEDQRQEALIAELNGLYGPGPSPARYMHYLEVGGSRLARAFKFFADEESYPVLVHCTAGKDRTGVLVGLVMDVLGCSAEDIAHEYGLSDASIGSLIEYLRASGRQLEGTDAEIRARLATPPERMAGFVQLLRARYGTAAQFFDAEGVTAADVLRVRKVLTDGDDERPGPDQPRLN